MYVLISEKNTLADRDAGEQRKDSSGVFCLVLNTRDRLTESPGLYDRAMWTNSCAVQECVRRVANVCSFDLQFKGINIAHF